MRRFQGDDIGFDAALDNIGLIEPEMQVLNLEQPMLFVNKRVGLQR